MMISFFLKKKMIDEGCYNSLYRLKMTQEDFFSLETNKRVSILYLLVFAGPAYYIYT